jgi:hypothetical protein
MAERSTLTGGRGIQGVKFLAWLETNGFPRGDADFGARSGIAADAGLARPDAEDAEPAQLDSVTGGQRLFETLKYSVYGRFRFGPRQASPLDNVVHYILLDQCPCPSIEENLAPFCCGPQESPTGEMLLGVGSVVNLRVLQYHKQLRSFASA